MSKGFTYTPAKELEDIAVALKGRYPTMIGDVEIGKIFFAWKSGELPDWYNYDIQGIKSDWVAYTSYIVDQKHYCVSFRYEYYADISETTLPQWIMIDLLHSCGSKMDGKLKRKDVSEFSRILDTLEDLEISYDWRNNHLLPDLLGNELINFAQSTFGVYDESL